MAQRNDEQPAILTIAGVDPSGGAGIQLRSVLEDINIRAIKTGALYDTNTICAVVQSLKAHYGTASLPPLVVDPVCVSTSGHTLLQSDAVESLLADVFPLATLITPNKSEAELILSHRNVPTPIGNLSDMLVAVKHLLTLGPKAVLLKGGHVTTTMDDIESVVSFNPGVEIVRGGLLGENMEILQLAEQDTANIPLVVDVLYDGTLTVLFIRPRIDSTSTHGTGCTLSAALACALSRGSDLVEATRLATQYTHIGIETAVPIGSGHGPLNHVHCITPRLIPVPTASNPHPFIRLLIQSNADVWKAYVQHEFVVELAKGKLDRVHFLHFIKQDYLYLKYYARAYGFLAAKSSTFPAISSATQTISNIIHEVTSHKAFCAQWGVTEKELECTPESPATTAYGAWILDIGLRGDASSLLMAVAACLLGYGEVGLWLKKEATKNNSWVVLEGNPYLKWIESYAGEDFQTAVKNGVAVLETMAVEDPPSPKRFEEWCAIWARCTLLEKGFWDMAMGLL
ncbi:hypothetical protein EUX98_g8039 [Antrodiella citrinella]|uniref:Pyridoxamine kinase/Phosphomethylpyrimidine kinase domain-containing protein n=1 Tax=Antrodiella citrinella TaxID=2447956 RepID=A0A4S4MIY3_9APHY|nr:hypothetical protein EUX98_g8039 [Antrodiella citrinella]